MIISGGLEVIPREAILVLIIFLCFSIKDVRLPTRRLMWPLLVLLAALLMLTLLRPGAVSLSSLMGRFANYFVAVLLLQVYVKAPEGALMKDLRALLFPMAIQAIATVVMAHTLGFLFLPFAIGEQNYLSLIGLFNYHISIEGLGRLIRPDGFFFEPGVFQIYLNLYLYLTIFVFPDPKKILLALLAVLSTQSTTGLVICMILLGASFLRHVIQGGFRRKVLVVFVALLLAPPLANFAYENITDKLSGTMQGSSWAREFDMYTGLRIAAEHPWMGIGFEVDRYLAASGRLGYEETLLTSSQLVDRPTSNGIVQLFYALGIPLALPFLYGIFRQKLFRHRLLIGLWLVLSLFGEALLFSPFFLFIVFSAFLVEPTTSAITEPRSVEGLPA